MYYKYLPPERIKEEGYFENELFRFTQPKYLNDPFECMPKKSFSLNYKICELIKSKIRKKRNNSVSSQLIEDSFSNLFISANLLNIFHNNYVEDINNEIGILSLSEIWNNTLMWSHYTEYHKGICVGFDSNHEFFEEYTNEDKTEFKKIKKVEYSNKRVKLPKDEKEEHLIQENYFTKSKDWKYEKEIRVIQSLNRFNLTSEKDSNIKLFKVPHEAIKEIIMGANIEKVCLDKIKIFCKKNTIKLFEAKTSGTTFDLVREEIKL